MCLQSSMYSVSCLIRSGIATMDKLIPPFYKDDHAFAATIASISGSDDAFLTAYLSNTTAPWKTVSWNELLQPFRDSWINTKQPPDSDSLDGKLVILDFFTYCCINCMHILPHLKRLETTFEESDIQVIGVHSAKFLNEKSTVNVTNAVSRYEISHPVINDVDCFLWRNFGVQCWPTLAVIDPEGRVIFWFEGESRMPELERLIERSLKFFREHRKVGTVGKKEAAAANVGFTRSPEEDGRTTSKPNVILSTKLTIRFPGKVAVSPSGRLLAISDSGHHRILIVDISVKEAGTVTVIIGQCGLSGTKNGDLTAAQFHSPQGLCWTNEQTLYVADTENHLIRKVDLGKGCVSTIGGTGRQGQDLVGGNVGHEQEISSPWDVVIAEIEPDNRSLLIAAAGTHQIWILPLESAITVGKRKFESNRLYCFAGSGHEAAKNNSYPHQAAFAQPSGVSVDGPPSSTAYIADSESSSIRALDLKSGAVKNVVGGDRNPENLFAFGDVDGVGLDVKLQHPLAIAYCSQTQKVCVADSYNHKIKEVDPTTRACRSLVLDFDDIDPKSLNEPGGICMSYPFLYIADTNNHRILVMNFETLRVKQLFLTPPRVSTDATDSVTKNVDVPTPPKDSQVVKLSSAANHFKIRIRLEKPIDLNFSDGAPHSWTISGVDPSRSLIVENQGESEKLSGDLRFVDNEASLPDLKMEPKKEKFDGVLFRLDLVIYLCNKKTGVCSMNCRNYHFRYRDSEGASDNSADAHLIIDWKL